MSELRYTDTNAADDSAGRAFGLDGNLYVPVVVAAVVAIGLFVLLAFGLHAGFVLAGLVGGLPLGAVLAWAVFLKHGQAAGYDRDRIDQLLGGGNFTREGRDQEGLA